ALVSRTFISNHFFWSDILTCHQATKRNYNRSLIATLPNPHEWSNCRLNMLIILGDKTEWGARNIITQDGIHSFPPLGSIRSLF
uniref:Uncharacterized protein n=1 Tax=Cucumis melo TaxID=3656 RepID=A0A9I9EJ43_CUCME